MHATASLWKAERPVRWFFVAHLQGALGAGAGYVALLLLAYERLGSAWGATAVLLADLLPAMLLGPLLGTLIDRTDRLWCAIVADLVRAAAFAGLALVDGPAAMIALALAAGAGTALFRPASYTLLPALVAPERLKAANGLFGAARDTGNLLGPVLAAVLLAFATPAAVLAVNAATFALCALALSRLRGHVRPVAPVAPAGSGSPPAPVGGGVRTVLADRRVRRLITASATVTMAAGTMNVAELVLAQRELSAGATGFALLLSAYGLGLVGGSLYAGRDGGTVQRRYAAGLATVALGMLATALAPGLAFALVTFAITGTGNGLFSVSNRTMLHRSIPERVHGRAFGLIDSVDSWGFALALLAGGALATTLGGRATFALAGTALAALFLKHNLKGTVPLRNRAVARPPAHLAPQAVSAGQNA